MDVFIISIQNRGKQNKTSLKKFEPEIILVVAIYKNTSQGQPQLVMMIRIFCVWGGEGERRKPGSMD